MNHKKFDKLLKERGLRQTTLDEFVKDVEYPAWREIAHDNQGKARASKAKANELGPIEKPKEGLGGQAVQ